MFNCDFNFNFLFLLHSEILGGSQIYTRGPYTPWVPLVEETFCTQCEYFTISNCVFNFNILALVVSESLRGSRIYVRGPVPPVRVLAENYCTRGEYFTMSNGFFNFNFLVFFYFSRYQKGL